MKGKFFCFRFLPSSQGSHYPLLLSPSVVTTELLNVSGGQMGHTKGLHLLFNPFG